MTIRALIFDRDGVLTDFDVEAATRFFQPLLPFSVWELAQEWQRFGERHGFPTSLAAERTFFAAFWDELAAQHHLAEEARRRLHALDYTQFVRAYPDAAPALRLARQAGYRIGVLSNFSLASLDASLAAAGLDDLVDATCAATVIGAAKPDRAAYEIAALALNVAPHECYFFDDEWLCVEGAMASGMQAWLVDRRRRCPAQITNVIPDLSAIAALLHSPSCPIRSVVARQVNESCVTSHL